VAFSPPTSAALRYWNMARQRYCRRLPRNGKPCASLPTRSVRSRIGRESTSWTSISAVSMPTPTNPSQLPNHGVGPGVRIRLPPAESPLRTGKTGSLYGKTAPTTTRRSHRRADRGRMPSDRWSDGRPIARFRRPAMPARLCRRRSTRLVLEVEDIFERAVEPIGPEMRAGERIDQLRGDAHAIARFAHRAFEA
jgi:hypothetical protein